MRPARLRHRTDDRTREALQGPAGALLAELRRLAGPLPDGLTRLVETFVRDTPGPVRVTVRDPRTSAEEFVLDILGPEAVP